MPGIGGHALQAIGKAGIEKEIAEMKEYKYKFTWYKHTWILHLRMKDPDYAKSIGLEYVASLIDEGKIEYLGEEEE